MAEPICPPRRPGLLGRALRAVGSLKLTVVLLVLAIWVVFCGTLAQVDDGVWSAVKTYFRSLYIAIPFQIFFPRSWSVPGRFPFPGGWLIGGILVVNLLAAHAVRFTWSWKKSALLMSHAGLIVLFLSEFITGLFAVAGNMGIDVNGSSNYIEPSQEVELAFVDPSDPTDDEVTAVPESFLRRKGVIRHSLLPVDLRVDRYFVNSKLVTAPPHEVSNPATAGEGLRVMALPAPEISGSDPNQTIDLTSSYVTLLAKGSDRIVATVLVSLTLLPQTVTLDGRLFQVALRFQRTYKPYTLHLKEFRHDVYVGTRTPKNFSSRVQLVDPTNGVDREALIYMNNPLRHAGETFYQSSFKPDDSGTVLQVVRNPGWLMPYVSCAMVGAGLVAHFMISLVQFLRRRKPV